MIVTLSLSPASARLVLSRGDRVIRWGQVSLVTGMVREGQVLQPEAVAAAIDRLFRDLKAPRFGVIACISGLSYVHRILTLPRIKPAKLLEAVERAARREIPVPLEDLYLSWYPLRPGKAESDYFVLGAPRQPVDLLLQCFEFNHIGLGQVDAKPLALARLARRANAVVVDFSPDIIDIVAITAGIPSIFHSVTPREGSTVEDNALRLADEVVKTVRYQSTGSEPSAIANIPLLLTGESSQDDATVRLIREAGIAKVERLVPPLSVPADFPAAQFSANLGMALKNMSPAPAKNAERFYDINLNVAAPKFRRKAVPLPISKVLLGLLVLITLGAMFLMRNTATQSVEETVHLQTEASRISRAVRDARAAGETARQTEAIITRTTAEAASLEQAQRAILASGGAMSSIIDIVIVLMPQGVYFTGMRLSSGEVEVDGETFDPALVVAYARVLAEQRSFANIRIVRIGEIKSGQQIVAAGDDLQYNFTISMERTDTPVKGAG